ERLQRVHGETERVRGECGERTRARYVPDPPARLHAARNLGDRRIRNAHEHELAAVRDGDATLAQAGADGRADAAGADDGDRFEHGRSSSVADTRHRKANQTLIAWRDSWVVASCCRSSWRRASARQAS